ncbi:hypothetical protein CRG98_007445 [Punica granatum]|uniref:Disease resistance RPP13-like protein 4 n=1 Tax=Punica granatum TaxID=22663 RepID=A0A2I0KWD8_PUNGR|nr:hypothetical protein CRG98_007445 [Punica granatum]
MLDAVVCVLLEKLLNVLSEQCNLVANLREQFGKMRSELKMMESFLKDAERLKRRNLTLKLVMVELRELIYEAEGILADCQLQNCDGIGDFSRSSSWKVCVGPSKLPFQYQLAKRLNEINEKIIEIRQKIFTYLRVPLQSTPEAGDKPLRWSSEIYNHTQVVGLENDTVKIKDWLFQGGPEILSIGVVGMGGLGKTTVAQKVFNEKEIDLYFERRMWVSVSQTFTEEKILRHMLRSLGDVGLGDNHGELLKKINQFLLSKRFLLVMDDVWSLEVDWWDRIYDGLPKGNGSCIIITTRNEVVAKKMRVPDWRIHRPKFLNDYESWLLFRKIAFAATGGECIYPHLEEIGKEIVDKCKGLPLAIKAIGGMMLCREPNHREWKMIAEHFRDELAGDYSDSLKALNASLQLSYDELPGHLKSSFLCLSLYPEDCVINKEQLMYWWIGEGFVPTRTGRSVIDSAEDCFSELSNRCLIEPVDKTYNGVIITCKIHDMVQELIMKIAREDSFFDLKDSISCRHWGINNTVKQDNFVANQKLRTLLSTTKTGEVNKVASKDAKSFVECRYLRVLDLSKSIFETPLFGLLRQIASLRHLTYLSLSNSHPLIELPESLNKLQNLQILDLSYCQNLRILPTTVATLKNLQVLDVAYCGSLRYLPQGIGNLSGLEVLLGFRPARPDQFGGSRVSELKKLTQLRKLGLQFTRGDEIGENEVDTLLNLQRLEFLSISCFDAHESDLITKLEKLSPPQNLHELSLKFYPGYTSPMWLRPESLPKLTYLSISSGNLAKMSQGFWGRERNVWKVRGLMLESLSDLAEEWSNFQAAMPYLRVVSVCWCPELESFPIEDVGFRGGVWTKGEKQN